MSSSEFAATVETCSKFSGFIGRISEASWFLFKGEECLWKSLTVIDYINKDTSHTGHRITNIDRFLNTGKWSLSIRNRFIFWGTDYVLPFYLFYSIIDLDSH